MIKKWYDNEVSKGILKNKYYHKNESEPEEFINRVSNIFSDDLKDKFKNYFSNADLSPAGRILYGAGAKGKFKSTTSNCYILPSPEDNIESIFKVNAEIARIFSYGGGIGVNISKLRPKDSTVNNAARSSTGAVSFLKIFDSTGEVISQNGRRGAIMIGLNCDHPDIYEFLHIKQNNEKLASMNISILFTDEFMKAVETDSDFELKFKVEATGQEIKKVIKAKEFFMEYCKTQWDWGDPGALFIDRFRRYNLLSGYKDYHLDITNPCVTGRTLILTKLGYKRIDSLVDKEVEIWNGFEWSKVTPKITGHNQKMLRITLSNGMNLDCTRYHKFILKNNTRLTAEKLSIGTKLAKWNYPVIKNDINIKHDFDAYTAGFYAGDGTKNRNEIALYGDKEKLLNHLDYHHYRNEKNRILVILNNIPNYKFFVPSSDETVKFRLEWLAGIIDSDGCRNDKTGSINITSIDYSFLQNIQTMLSTLGCFSYINMLKDEIYKEMPLNDGTDRNGVFHCQKSYRLTISAYEVEQLFKLGLVLYRVDVNPQTNRNASRFIYVKKIEEINDEETVYCFNEPKNHSGIFNGIMTAQCGEFAGNAYNSCNLLSLNIYNFIEDKFNNPYLNENKLKDAVDVGIQALDEVLDYGYDTQPLDKNRECIDDWRSIGLGVFGLADALVAMKLRYGSKEGNVFVEKVMKTIFYESLRFDALLAKKKGSFRKYDWDLTNKSALIQMTKKEEPAIYNLIKENGLRNGTLVSIAPTGTISLLMGCFTGGCEPIYQISYERTSHKMEDNGKTFKVYAHSVEDLLNYNKIDLNNITNKEIKKRFPWIIESHDVPFMERVDLQSIMQKYVDNSISSTVNLRNNATPDDIFDIYLEAWKSKCKGITVFRDGCKRGNILGVSKDKSKQEIIYNSIHPNKRENVKQVQGYTLVRKTSCVDKMYVTINKTSSGEIFEIFTNVSGGCQSNITTITRLASLALRSGVKVEDVIKQLTTAKCSACQALIRNGKKDISLSCGNAIGSALAEVYNMHKEKEDKYVDVDDNPAINSECPECHHHTLKPDGKCVTCTRCGWSRCE